MKDLLFELLLALILLSSTAIIAMPSPPDESICKFPCNEYDWTAQRGWISQKEVTK